MPPFNAMVLDVTFKLVRAALLPRPAFIATLELVPEAVMLRLRAVPSLLIVPLVVITEALPLAANFALEPKVIAPA